jgi:hypothetical protein
MRNPKYRTRSDLKTREEAWPIIEPYAQQFYDWLNDAWTWVQKILDDDPERRAIMDSSTVSSMVYDRFRFLMKNGLLGDKHIMLIAEGRMTRASINGEIVLRFKKFDKRLTSHNAITGNQDLIYNQQYRLEDIGERPTNVTFGYITDITATKLAGVYFTCPKSWRQNKWTIKVGGSDESGAMLFDPNGFGGTPSEPVVGTKEKVGT